MLFNYFNNNTTVFNYFKNIENPIILHFDEMRGETPNRMQLHSHDFVEIFYFFKGEGYFVTPDKTYPIHPHDIVVVDSHKQHTEYSSDVNHIKFKIQKRVLERLAPAPIPFFVSSGKNCGSTFLIKPLLKTFAFLVIVKAERYRKRGKNIHTRPRRFQAAL